MLYAFLKVIVRIALRIFFKSLRVNNLSRLSVDGPLIVVANHPNTFMDPIVIACFLKQQVYFLTNGSIFNTPFKKRLLNLINMVPIYRKEDSGGKSPDNREVFKKCYEFLNSGGTLIIFPEGSSVNERRLRKLKTGTARIALGAEQEYDFDLDLNILTIGLNYSDARRFRSELYVNADEIIQVKDFKEAYQTDNFKAAKQLTDHIEDRLAQHIIITKNQEDDLLAQRIETIYKGQLFEESELPHQERDFRITKTIVEAIHYFQEESPKLVEEVEQEISDYFTQLDRLKVKDKSVAGEVHKNFISNALFSLIYTVLGFPLYLLGLAGNYIPYILPSKVANALTKEVEYIAPIMMAVGIFTFPLCYSLQITGLYMLTGKWILCLIYGLSLPISGFFVLHYWNHLITTQNHFLIFSIFMRRNKLIQDLVNRRKRIIRLLEDAKDQFLATN